MQKYDWLRLFSEVRPTFLPYARFTVQTRLSPEECRERLAAVTQPQKLPTLFSVRTSDDPRLSLKGQVSASGFLAVPVDHTGSRRFQGPQPFWIKGRIVPVFDGTDIAVQVYMDPTGFVAGISVLAYLVTMVSFAIASTPTGLYDVLMKFLGITMFSLLSVFIGSAVVLGTSLKAFRLAKTLERLLTQSADHG